MVDVQPLDRPPPSKALFRTSGLWPLPQSRWAEILLVVGLVAAVAAMVATARQNLARQNIATGFDILFRQTGWDVSFAVIPHAISDPYWWTFLVGLGNTAVVAAICITLATLLGLLLALCAASGNALVQGLATAYVYLIRNVPQIVHVFFWYNLTRQLPPVRQSVSFGDTVFLSNRGLYVPWPSLSDERPLWLTILLCTILAIAFVALRLRGARAPFAIKYALALLVVGVGAMWLWFRPEIGLSMPRLRGFNFEGGATLPPEFVALVTAVTIYNAAFVAEIVRAGLGSVPHGQIEAARNIGLSNLRLFWKITLPQAIRVIVPPLTNQYISIAKSSSLAVAIGFTELFSVGTIAINHTGQAFEVIAILMAIYCGLSFSISAAGGIWNARTVRKGAR